MRQDLESLCSCTMSSEETNTSLKVWKKRGSVRTGGRGGRGGLGESRNTENKTNDSRADERLLMTDCCCYVEERGSCWYSTVRYSTDVQSLFS